jgi:hypothetical protein
MDLREIVLEGADWNYLLKTENQWLVL